MTPYSKTGIRLLHLVVPIIIILLSIFLIIFWSLPGHKREIDIKNGIQALIPSFGLSPTSSPIVSTPNSGTVFLPFMNKFGFNEQGRPYSADSYWNTPINNPEYDPHSTEMVATIGMHRNGTIGSEPNQYTFPVYYTDNNTPRWDIPCTSYKCTVVTLEETFTVEVLSNVPIPDLATPSDGTDAQMIIIDMNTFTEYDLWQAKHTSEGWTVSNASVYNILWDGTPPRYGSRGAGLPYMAGLVRPWEIIQGRIDHGLAFGYPEPDADSCVYPASRTDGDSSLPYAIPQGAHLQLDPTLTEADFNSMGLNSTGKIIARALQVYGMTLVDTSGQAKIYVEDLKNNPYSEVSWSDPELNLTSTTIGNIPYSYFRVLKLPDAYWNSQLTATEYRECYDYPDH